MVRSAQMSPDGVVSFKQAKPNQEVTGQFTDVSQGGQLPQMLTNSACCIQLPSQLHIFIRLLHVDRSSAATCLTEAPLQIACVTECHCLRVHLSSQEAV